MALFELCLTCYQFHLVRFFDAKTRLAEQRMLQSWIGLKSVAADTLFASLRTAPQREIFHDSLGKKSFKKWEDMIIFCLLRTRLGITFKLIWCLMGKGAVPSSRCARFYEKGLYFINKVAKLSWQRRWDEVKVLKERYPLFSGHYKRIHLIGDCSSTPVERSGDRFIDSCMYSSYYGMHCTKVSAVMHVMPR